MTQIEKTDLARDALYTKVNTMNGECVHKSGDETISGRKTFTISPYITTSSTDCRLVSKTNNYEQGTAPTSAMYGGYRFVDKNGVEMSTCYSSVDTSNTNKCMLFVKSPVSGSTSIKQMGIKCDAAGVFTTECPTPTEDTATSTQIDTVGARNTKLTNYLAKSALSTVHCVISTYVNGTSGYRIYDDGYCEQWGELTSSANVTFLKKFKNTNYIITLGQSGSGASASVGRTTWNNKTDNGFNPNYSTPTDWKASGYLAEGQY